jgi:nucleoside-diphosphate-sugar epimerase
MIVMDHAIMARHAQSMKIVITGALGHVGSRLVQTMPADFPGTEFLLIDDLETQRYCSLFDLPAARFRFEACDILRATLEPLFEGADAVVHLAATVNPASFEQRGGKGQANLEVTERVARACVATGVPMFFPSTTSVYGSRAEMVDESCRELIPQSPYAETKLLSEQSLARIAGKSGLRYVICRFGTIFGPSPGMRFHTAVNKFIWQASFGLPLTVWRTALDQRRPYLDIDDAVTAISFVISKRIFDGSAYNVVTTNRLTREIIEIIRRHVPGLCVELMDNPIMNELSYGVCAKKLEQLGFEFRGDLEEAIAATFRLLANAGALNRS